MVGPAVEGESVIPFNAIVSRWLVRRAWLASLTLYACGLMSLRTFTRVDDAYYTLCVRRRYR